MSVLNQYPSEINPIDQVNLKPDYFKMSNRYFYSSSIESYGSCPDDAAINGFSTLSLFVLGVLADNADAALSLDHFALFTDGFHR